MGIGRDQGVWWYGGGQVGGEGRSHDKTRGDNSGISGHADCTDFFHIKWWKMAQLVDRSAGCVAIVGPMVPKLYSKRRCRKPRRRLLPLQTFNWLFL